MGYRQQTTTIMKSKGSRFQVFHRIDMKIYTNFTGKYLRWSLFFNKVAGCRLETFFKKGLLHMYFPVNFGKYIRMAVLQNTNCLLLFEVTI